MLLKSFARRISTVLLISLATATFAVAETSKTDVQKEAIQLIEKVESVSRDIRNQAERLDSFSRDSLITSSAHFHHLNQIKELINDGLNPALVRLTAIQKDLPDWKQQAIEDIVTRAKLLATDANAAISNKNETKYLPAALNYDYAALISSINEHADALIATSDAAGNYAKAHLKGFEAGLDLPQF